MNIPIPINVGLEMRPSQHLPARYVQFGNMMLRVLMLGIHHSYVMIEELEWSTIVRLGPLRILVSNKSLFQWQLVGYLV